MAVAIIMLAAGPLDAQAPRPERPYQGLFGGGLGKMEQLLTLSASLGGGYDTNILTGSTTASAVPADPHATKSSTFGQGQTGLAYSLNGRRLGLSAAVDSSASYYPTLQNPFIVGYGASAGGSWKISSRTQLAASSKASYQPYYFLPGLSGLLDPTPGIPSLFDPTFGARENNHFLVESAVGLTQALTSRVELSLSYDDLRSTSRSHDRDLFTKSGGGRIATMLGKGLGLHVGYGYSDARYGRANAQHLRSHNIDAGLDFSRTLSFSRRTTLSFGTGSAVFTDGHRTNYFLTGNAALNHEIGRTWTTGISVSRNAAFDVTFRQPVLSDAAGLHVSGLVARRLQIQSGLGVVTGRVGFSQPGDGFTSYYAHSGLTLRLTQFLGLGVDYSYYRYVFGSGIELPSGLTHRTDRQSVRVSLNLWAPLIHRTGRPPDASR